jgi:hypothetical protein
MYDDPVLKRPDKKSDESTEKTVKIILFLQNMIFFSKNCLKKKIQNSIQTGPNFGRFTGGIDVKMLRPDELEGAFKAWTRKVKFL